MRGSVSQRSVEIDRGVKRFSRQGVMLQAKGTLVFSNRHEKPLVESHLTNACKSGPSASICPGSPNKSISSTSFSVLIVAGKHNRAFEALETSRRSEGEAVV